MISDDDLNNANQNSLKVWAPLHAWRTLGQLQALEAAGQVIHLFDKLRDDDWIPKELPKVLSLIGPASIPEIASFLANGDIDETVLLSVPECLERIAMDHQEHRDECVDVLVGQLSSYKTNGPFLNAFLILSLADLKATSTIDVIREAFAADCVELTVQGDVEDVEIEMGLRVTRDTPLPDLQLIPGLPRFDLDDVWDQGLKGQSGNTVVRPHRHVGRNDPCPCGSGKKFKKCCLQ